MDKITKLFKDWQLAQLDVAVARRMVLDAVRGSKYHKECLEMAIELVNDCKEKEIAYMNARSQR